MTELAFTSAQKVAEALHSRPLRIITPATVTEPLPAPSSARQRWCNVNSHSHTHREILIPLRGTYVFGMGGTFYPCAPGTAFCFDSGEEHEVGYPERVGPFDHLWFGLMEEHAVGTVHEIRKDRQGYQTAHHRLFHYDELGVFPGALFPGAEEECSVEIRYERLRILTETMLLRAMELFDTPTEVSKSVFQQRVVQAIQQHIRETAGCGVSLDELARLAGYSKYHFLRLFKAHAACTVQQYIDRCRINRAKKMLVEEFQSKEIGAALGFSCPAAFSRWRRRHGV